MGNPYKGRQKIYIGEISVMNKKNLIEQISKGTKYTQKEITTIIDSFLGLIILTLVDGEDVYIPKFGKFKIAKQIETKRRNPHTGAIMISPEKRVPKFKPSTAFKEAIANS